MCPRGDEETPGRYSVGTLCRRVDVGVRCRKTPLQAIGEPRAGTSHRGRRRPASRNDAVAQGTGAGQPGKELRIEEYPCLTRSCRTKSFNQRNSIQLHICKKAPPPARWAWCVLKSRRARSPKRIATRRSV